MPSAEAISNEEELFLVSQKAFEDGFYDVAERYIQQFLKSYPETEKRIPAQLLLGQCYFFKNQYLKAFDIFQSLEQSSEFKDVTFFWLGETYFKGSDYNNAKKYYKKIINLYPDSLYLPQTYYSLAWTFFEQGDYENATLYFLKLITKFPAHHLSEDATFKLAESEHNAGEFERARNFFQKYVLKYPQSTRHAEIYFYIAEGYYYSEDYLMANTYYAKAADVAYDHKLICMATVSMGWCYLKLEKYDLSEKYFDQALEIATRKDILYDDIYLGQANLYSEKEEYTKSLDAYRKLISTFPKSLRIAEAYLGKANIHYTLKEYPQAIEAYQWIINQYADVPQRQEIIEKAYYGLAWTFLKSGEPDRSIKNFEQIMSKTDNKIVKISALTQIGDAYQDSDQLEKAIDVYDRILTDYPDSIYTDYIQFRQGIALLKLDKFEAATLSFQSLGTNFPKSKYLDDARYYLGVAYFKKEEWRPSITHIEQYLNKEDESFIFISEAKYILSLSYFNLKNYKKALQIFQEITRDYPDQKTVTRISELHVAKCLYELGQIKEAIKQFRLIIERYPDTEATQEALVKLGDHYLEQADFEQAITFYSKFINNFPGSEKAGVIYYELGQTYEAQGAIDKALEAYKHIGASADKEVYAKARLAIADIFSQQLDPETAIETYRKIAQSVPEFYRDAYKKIANIYRNNQEFHKVIETLSSALKMKKSLSMITSVELEFDIADTYELLNQSEKAVEAYLRISYLYAQEISWVIKAYLRVGRIFEDTEKWQDAVAIYNKVIAFNTEETKYALERITWINDNILQ
ncbi:MAG: tetratricopeptide repeat protein [Candidatus Omnitrophica bacterium]|nr:tetratricopeptide repeat protein [Candidatus Omnitrophota bacterium]